MLKELIQVRQVYVINHAGAKCNVRVDEIVTIEGHRGGFYGRSVTRYKCTKLSTGRQITVKSHVKFLGPAVFKSET